MTTPSPTETANMSATVATQTTRGTVTTQVPSYAPEAALTRDETAPNSPCPLAKMLAEGLPGTLTPAEAIHAALSQLDDFEWDLGGLIDFTGLAPCAGCERWQADTVECADGQRYCDQEGCLPESADSELP